MNNKGFTLVELLITITILGIVLAFSIAIVNNLSTKNKKQSYQIYSDALLQSSKIYNDSYSEDTFANREYGCTKVSYSSLKNKDLISDITLKGAKCGYMLGSNQDSSGVVIRKVKNKYYYETFLFCKEDGVEANREEDYVKGGEIKYFYQLGDDYCNMTAAVDKDAPKVYYRNNKTRPGHFYNRNNLPQPQVKITDNGVGLNNILDVNYKWSSKGNLELLRFNTRKGAGTTRWKDVPLSPDIKKSGVNYAEHINVTIKNVEDLAKNVNTNSLQYPDPLDSDAGQTGTFYVDNHAPEIIVTNRITWRRTAFTITMNVKDEAVHGIRSGIKSVTYTLTNTYASPGNAGLWTKTSTAPGNGLNGNYSAAAGGSSSDKFKKTIRINKPGNYSLKVRVEDWSGNIKTQEYASYYQFDNIPPTCGSQSPSNPRWINRDRTITVGCSDQTNLSGCTQNRYSQSFGESYTGNITIIDNAGNPTTCSVVTKVDKTKPSCTSRGGSDRWQKANRTIYGDCSDRGSVQSGCKRDTYSKVYSGNVKTKKAYGGRAYDVAGNYIDCSKDQVVHIDNTPPTCSMRGVNQNRAYIKVRVLIYCHDNYSLKKCDNVSASGNDIAIIRKDLGNLGVGTHTKTVVDSAGNRAQCSISVSESRCSKCPESCCNPGWYIDGNCCTTSNGGHASVDVCEKIKTCYTRTCTSGRYCGYHT